jgi:hypothetical protein
VTGFEDGVTVAIEMNPANGSLTGTTTVDAVAGVASFATLSIDKSGTGYTLSASAAGLVGETSASFDIAAGPASQLVITLQPTHTVAGDMIAPAVQVTAQDALGNTAIDFTGDVTMTIGANPVGGTLAGATTAPVVAGSPSSRRSVSPKREAGTPCRRMRPASQVRRAPRSTSPSARRRRSPLRSSPAQRRLAPPSRPPSGCPPWMSSGTP